MNTFPTIHRIRSAGPTISAGIISANLSQLGEQVSILEDAGLEMLHFDVMDGHFVPALTVGPFIIKAIQTRMLKDVHLMISDPLEKIEWFVKAGADCVTLHVEAGKGVGPGLKALGDMANPNNPGQGIVRGIALFPETPLQSIEPLLGDVEMVVPLAVDPRKPGSKFMDAMPGRMAELQKMLSGHKDIIVCVDGGVAAENAAAVGLWGADAYVSGSALFKGGRPGETIARMLKDLRNGRS